MSPFLLLFVVLPLALATCGQQDDYPRCQEYTGLDGPCYWCSISQDCLHQCHRRHWGHCHGENTTFGENKCYIRKRNVALIFGVPVAVCLLSCVCCCTYFWCWLCGCFPDKNSYDNSDGHICNLLSWCIDTGKSCCPGDDSYENLGDYPKIPATLQGYTKWEI